MQVTFNGYYTLISAVIVLMIGRVLVRRIRFLRDFNIPEPVAGGLLVALAVTILYHLIGLSVSIDTGLQNALMLMFFSSIGLSADFSRLKEGGLPLIIFLAVVTGLIFIQNVVGVSLATLFGLKPLTGLITGSITLTGGHGTAIGWSETLTKLGVPSASELGVACATFGLVAGGLIGGPLARHIINSGVKTPGTTASVQSEDLVFEGPRQTRLITVDSALETLAMFAICLAASHYMTLWMKESFPNAPINIPTFVWALGTGVIVRNTLTRVFKFEVFDRCIDVYGNVALSLFLAMALMSLKLWELSGLALPILGILLVQSLIMLIYAKYVTFRAMGKDYDAVVLAAGHCGFGMGATPTAVANMQSVTQRFGPSHKAFLIVPMVGAFFVDIVNALVLSGFTSMGFLQ